MTDTPTIGRMFADDTKDHQLTILLDQGEHRHLRAHTVDAETGRPLHLYSVNLVTWPGRVAVSGDMDGFTFRVDLDTLRATTQRRISWHYLAHLVDAGAENVRGYSEDMFHEHIRDQVARDIRDRAAPKGIGRAIHDQIFNAWEYDLEVEADARHALTHFEHDGYRFDDVDHDDFDDFTTDFKRAVLGVQLVIRLYDRHQAAQAAHQAAPKTLGREAFDRQQLIHEYRGEWAVNPATATNIPKDQCPVCGTTTTTPDEWAEHMADHGTEAFSWLSRWQDTHPEAA